MEKKYDLFNKKYDAFINAVNYEKKLAYRHLKEMEERMDYTAKNHVNVDLSPMIMTMQFYRTRIDTYNHSLRLYRKHTKNLLPIAPKLTKELKGRLVLGAEQEGEV
jgi:hypothetical protein